MAEKEKDKAAKHKAANKKKEAQKKGQVERLATGTIEKSKETPRLRKHYVEKVIAELMDQLKKTNKHEVPKLEKIVINMGVNEAKENIQALDVAREELAAIAGQRPQVRRAKKSISNFKLREGMPIGVRVTLRGDRMYEFLDRLTQIAVPRIRDFRGLNAGAFDGKGNYNMGVKEHHIFPEINLEKSPKARGLNITFVTTAKTDDEGRALLSHLGVPFKKKDKE